MNTTYNWRNAKRQFALMIFSTSDIVPNIPCNLMNSKSATAQLACLHVELVDVPRRESDVVDPSGRK